MPQAGQVRFMNNHLEEDVMSRVQRFRIKNAMIFGNLISNVIGIAVIILLYRISSSNVSEELLQLIERTNLWFIPLSILLPLTLSLIYERPIRKHFEDLFGGRTSAPEVAMAARRRLLNEPFFLILIDFSMWIAAAIVYSMVAGGAGAGTEVIRSIVTRSLLTGLITVTVAFFVLEFVLQRRVVPHVFPTGGLHVIPGSWRIRIPTRLVALLFACNLVPFIAILNLIPSQLPPEQELPNFLTNIHFAVAAQAVIFMGVGIWLTFLVSSNLTRPLREIIHVLQSVRKGNFDGLVRVTTNDEIGYTGDVINEMTKGLKEREFLKETFGKYITEEVRDEILSGRVPLDGELREVTVLFSDLRDFTPLAERLPPKEVIKILNQYFREMEEAIRGHRGLVLHYIGDEIDGRVRGTGASGGSPGNGCGSGAGDEAKAANAQRVSRGTGLPPALPWHRHPYRGSGCGQYRKPGPALIYSGGRYREPGLAPAEPQQGDGDRCHPQQHHKSKAGRAPCTETPTAAASEGKESECGGLHACSG